MNALAPEVLGVAREHVGGGDERAALLRLLGRDRAVLVSGASTATDQRDHFGGHGDHDAVCGVSDVLHGVSSWW